MSVKIALLGFGTVASGVPFLLKENGEKIVQAAHSEIEVAKVLAGSIRPINSTTIVMSLVYLLS